MKRTHLTGLTFFFFFDVLSHIARPCKPASNALSFVLVCFFPIQSQKQNLHAIRFLSSTIATAFRYHKLIIIRFFIITGIIIVKHCERVLVACLHCSWSEMMCKWRNGPYKVQVINELIKYRYFYDEPIRVEILFSQSNVIIL